MSEKVEKRKKKLSKHIYGTSHTLSEDEAKHVANACKQPIFGTGHDAMAPLAPEGSVPPPEEAAGHRYEGKSCCSARGSPRRLPHRRLVNLLSSCCSLVAG